MRIDKCYCKYIPNYEHLYMCSTNGDVISIPRNGTINDYRILKPKVDKDGYYRVVLYKNNNRKEYSIHRLVAMTFIQNKDNLPQVNHIDGNKKNNNIDNLEWCDNFRNSSHAYEIGLNKRRYGKDNDKSKEILQFTLDGKFIKKWYSSREIERELGYKHCNILACCSGKYKKSNGYIWKYK